MSDPIKVMDSSKFNSVHILEEFELLESSEVHQGRRMYVLVLRPEKASDSQLMVPKADRHDWLALAHHILRTLDPRPEDQVLDSLRRIERLLEQRRRQICGNPLGYDFGRGVLAP